MKRIATHDGKFHPDEALACFLVQKLQLWGEAETVEIVRTRQPDLLNQADVVVDVGGVYDPATLRFDHHQREFCTTFSPEFSTKLSSAGLVYKHFGRAIIDKLAGHHHHLTDQDLDQVYHRVYQNYIEPLDALDNGIPRFTERQPTAQYRAIQTIASVVDRLNPLLPDEHQDEQFGRASELIGQDFARYVYYECHRWIPARKSVRSALMHCLEQTDERRQILVLHAPVPWKEHLKNLEQDLKLSILYVVFPVEGRDADSSVWYVQAVPKALPGDDDADQETDFVDRKPLPASWRGLRDAELARETGIEKCVFIHASGFIGANASFQGVMQMAIKAIQAE